MNTSMTVFSAAVRTNANGASMGRRVSFVSEVPAGDVRKHLKGQGLKGKELTKQVDRILRGDSTLGWASFEASVSQARSNGFVPTVGDLNKNGNKLTMKLERPSTSIDKQDVIHAARTQLTEEELLSILAEREAAKANTSAINV